MTEMVKTVAFRSGRDGEESFRVVDVEEDGLINSGYPRSLPGGFESTLNRLSKWIVSGLFSGLIIWRHDTETLWILVGSVLNAMLSIALKRILNQERPVSNLRSDPGMPSSHAQSIFFIFSFAIFSIVESLGINEGSLAISGLVLASGTYLTWLRVSQQLHTIPQVVVGAAVGSTFFTLWILSWNAFVMEAFDSNLWVQIIVYLGAAGFCLGFLLYVIRNWFKDEL